MSSLAKRMIVPMDEPDSPGEVRAEELRLLEAMLFASAEPLDEASLAARLPAEIDLRAALARLQQDYSGRGVNLVRVGGKWTFRTASDLSWLLSKETVETRKLSRAAMVRRSGGWFQGAGRAPALPRDDAVLSERDA